MTGDAGGPAIPSGSSPPAVAEVDVDDIDNRLQSYLEGSINANTKSKTLNVSVIL